MAAFVNDEVLGLLRRLVAVLSVVLMVGSLSEPALGWLRDGPVHHESTATAVAHGTQFLGDHGHEDRGPSTNTHDREHLHGTGADHCTHQHGLGPVSMSPSGVHIGAEAARLRSAHQMMFLSQYPLDLFHPPRA